MRAVGGREIKAEGERASALRIEEALRKAEVPTVVTRSVGLSVEVPLVVDAVAIAARI